MGQKFQHERQPEMSKKNTHGEDNMRKEYDFSQSVRNPYARKLKRQITIRIENETIEYFKRLAVEMDMPYQKLINLFLKDCAQSQMRPSLKWKSFAASA
jgi:predicted DNA binding CopG/RHH family protein